MDLFRDGKLDDRLAADYLRALEVELLKRGKAWLAQRLALEIVDREIERHLRSDFDDERMRIAERLRKDFESIAMGALRQLDGSREDWLLGIRNRQTQRARRFDKPAADPYDATRNDRIRAFHARLLAQGRTDATAGTAGEFGLSARQIRNILKATPERK